MAKLKPQIFWTPEDGETLTGLVKRIQKDRDGKPETRYAIDSTDKDDLLVCPSHYALHSMLEQVSDGTAVRLTFEGMTGPEMRGKATAKWDVETL